MERFKKNNSIMDGDSSEGATKPNGSGGQQPYDHETGKYGGEGFKKSSSIIDAKNSENDSGDLTKPAQNSIIFKQPTPNDFVATIAATKASQPDDKRWRVDIHSEADYTRDKLFTTSGGSCIAVEPSGNIISVCKSTNENIRGSELLKKAIENGGDRLDAFGEKLYDFYTKNGFEPVSYTPFNEEYAPDGWVKGRDAAEPVIFYKYTGQRTKLTYKEFLRTTSPASDYGAAQQLRDKEIK